MKKILKILFLLVVTFSSLSIKAQESDATYEETVNWLNNNISKTKSWFSFMYPSLGVHNTWSTEIESESGGISFEVIATIESKSGNLRTSEKAYYSDIINVDVKKTDIGDKRFGDDSVLTVYLSESTTKYTYEYKTKESKKEKINQLALYFNPENYHNKRVLKALKHLAYLNKQKNGEKF